MCLEQKKIKARWWFPTLSIFTLKIGEMIQFDEQRWVVQPPPRKDIKG